MCAAYSCYGAAADFKNTQTCPNPLYECASASALTSAQKTGLVVTIENHSIRGGIGSIVCEQLSESMPTRVVRLGVDDEFGQSGTSDELLDFYGLSSSKIVDKVIEILK